MRVRARVLASRDLLAYIQKAGLPAILTGDLNATPETEEIRMLAARLTDATQNLGGTFHDFGRYSFGIDHKIDYIFTSLPTDPARAYAVADIPDATGLYTSDHTPVVAYATLEN